MELPRTRWTLILACRDEPELQRRALAELLQSYWLSLYQTIRSRGHSAEISEDALQAFAVHLLEKDALARLDPSKGKLRVYLKTALLNCLSSSREKAQAEKRGGAAQTLTLDHELAEELPVSNHTRGSFGDRRGPGRSREGAVSTPALTSRRCEFCAARATGAGGAGARAALAPEHRADLGRRELPGLDRTTRGPASRLRRTRDLRAFLRQPARALLAQPVLPRHAARLADRATAAPRALAVRGIRARAGAAGERISSLCLDLETVARSFFRSSRNRRRAVPYRPVNGA